MACSLAIFPALASITSGFTSNVILSGKVTDYAGKPLDVVRIRVEDSNGVGLDRILELKPVGMLNVGLGDVSDDIVRCYISADGFESAQITAPVQGDRALLNTVKLKRFIELETVGILPGAADQFVYLDFWITSRTLRPLIIKEVGVKGEERKQGPCFDAGPRISFQFKNIEVEDNSSKVDKKHKTLKLTVVVHRDGAKDQERSFKVFGTFDHERCGPSIVGLAARYSFSIDSEDQNKPIKLRIVVPSRFRIKGFGFVRPDWEHGSIFLTLANGERVSAEVTR
jgi:hypothetical protein